MKKEAASRSGERERREKWTPAIPSKNNYFINSLILWRVIVVAFPSFDDLCWGNLPLCELILVDFNFIKFHHCVLSRFYFLCFVRSLMNQSTRVETKGKLYDCLSTWMWMSYLLDLVYLVRFISFHPSSDLPIHAKPN